MQGKHNDDVVFVVEYDDWRKAYIGISPRELRTGDHVARTVAGELQRSGQIPAGAIVRVTRAGIPEMRPKYRRHQMLEQHPR